jgi:23S rRNA (cytidine2498-2'-O)-methyltransferase
VRVYLVTPGSEAALTDELGAAAAARTLMPGVVEAAEALPASAAPDPVFSRQMLPDATLVRGESVRALAEAAYAATERAVDAWSGSFTLHTITPAAIHPELEAEPGLGARADLVGRAWLELVSARRRRASRRYQAAAPAPPAFDERWLLVQALMLERDRAWVSAAAPRRLARGGTDLACWPAGAAPVAFDRTPPSRAYRKLEEAFAWLGAAPAAGELCVDLGAAPGGWTLTAARRGARVVAVDRAPLDPAVARHPGVTQVIGNAFTYAPAGPVDWLLSDVVCEPRRSLALVDGWLERGLCRSLVVTVKFKGRGGYGALGGLDQILDRHRPAFARVKQLVNNKNEVCIMITRSPPEPNASARMLRDRP